VIQEFLAQRVNEVTEDLLAHKETLENLVHRDQKDHKERMETQVLQENKDL